MPLFRLVIRVYKQPPTNSPLSCGSVLMVILRWQLPCLLRNDFTATSVASIDPRERRCCAGRVRRIECFMVNVVEILLVFVGRHCSRSYDRPAQLRGRGNKRRLCTCSGRTWRRFRRVGSRGRLGTIIAGIPASVVGRPVDLDPIGLVDASPPLDSGTGWKR
jgi:hypothetical protein